MPFKLQAIQPVLFQVYQIYPNGLQMVQMYLESEMARYAPAEVIIPDGNENVQNWMVALAMNGSTRWGLNWRRSRM